MDDEEIIPGKEFPDVVIPGKDMSWQRWAFLGGVVVIALLLYIDD